MSLKAIQPLRYGGVKSTWLSTLPDSGTEMLTISSTGVVSRQAIPSASFAALTGLPSDNAALQSALDAKLNLSGGTLTGTLNATTINATNVRCQTGGGGIMGTRYLNNGNDTWSAFEFPQNQNALTFSPSATGGLFRFEGTTSSHVALKRNGSTLQVRLADDSAAANLSCASVACTEIDFGFNLGFPRKIVPQNYGVIIPGNSTWEGSFTTGNNRVTLSSGISFWFNTAGGDDASIHRVGTGYDNANLDIRAKNGLRIRNMNNSAFSNLQAQTGTFGEGPSTNGGAWVVDPVNTNLKWDQYGINYLTLQGRADAQSLSFVNPSVAPFVGRGQMDGGNRVGFYFNPTSISVGAVSGYTSTPVTLGVTGRVSASHGTLTASSPALSLTQTWNNAAVAFNAIDVDITNTASAIQSTFATFRRGGTNRIVLYDRYDNVAQGPGVQFGAGIVQEASGGHVALGTTGDPGMVGLTNGMGLSMHPSRYIGWGSTGSATRDQGSAWTDVRMYRNGSGPSLQVQAAGGLNVRNLDGSADAPFTAGAITVSARISVTDSDAIRINSASTTTGGLIAAGTTGFLPVQIGGGAYNSNGLLVVGDGSYLGIRNTGGLYWVTSTNPLSNAAQTGIISPSAGLVEINNGTAGQTRDLSCRAINGTGNIALTGSNPQVRLGAVDQGYVEYSSGALNLGHTYATRLAVNATQITSLVPIVTSQTVTSGMQTLVADPSTVDITTGLNRMVKNSTSGEVRHWVNDGGTMKSVLFT